MRSVRTSEATRGRRSRATGRAKKNDQTRVSPQTVNIFLSHESSPVSFFCKSSPFRGDFLLAPPLAISPRQLSRKKITFDKKEKNNREKNKKNFSSLFKLRKKIWNVLSMKVEAELGSDRAQSLEVETDFYFVNRIRWEETFGSWSKSVQRLRLRTHREEIRLWI